MVSKRQTAKLLGPWEFDCLPSPNRPILSHRAGSGDRFVPLTLPHVSRRVGVHANRRCRLPALSTCSICDTSFNFIPVRSLPPSLRSLSVSFGLIRSHSVSLGPFIVKTSLCLSLMFASPVVGYVIAMVTSPLGRLPAGALPASPKATHHSGPATTRRR